MPLGATGIVAVQDEDDLHDNAAVIVEDVALAGGKVMMSTIANDGFERVGMCTDCPAVR